MPWSFTILVGGSLLKSLPLSEFISKIGSIECILVGQIGNKCGNTLVCINQYYYLEQQNTPCFHVFFATYIYLVLYMGCYYRPVYTGYSSTFLLSLLGC